jgi:hypothetical protein
MQINFLYKEIKIDLRCVNSYNSHYRKKTEAIMTTQITSVSFFSEALKDELGEVD